MARNNETTMTLNMKISQLLSEKKDLEAKYKKQVDELKNKNANLEKELLSIKRGISIFQTEEDTTKKILSLKAQMLSPTTIRDRLNYIGIEISLEDIKNIVYNIDELEMTLKDYYNECIEAYNNSLKTNNNILKNKALAENQYMIDMIKEIIEEVSDPFEKTKQMDKLDKYLNTMNSLLKDVVLEQDIEDKNQIIINNMDKDYEQSKQEIFKIKYDENIQVLN